MRIKCPHCQTKAIITHQVTVNNKMSEVYVNCPNIDCGARSKMRISHIAYLTPPAEILTNAMHEWFANLPDQEKQQIQQIYQPSLF